MKLFELQTENEFIELQLSDLRFIILGTKLQNNCGKTFYLLKNGYVKVYSDVKVTRLINGHKNE